MSHLKGRNSVYISCPSFYQQWHNSNAAPTHGSIACINCGLCRKCGEFFVLVVSFCENLTVLVWDMLSMCVLIFLQHVMHKKQQVFGTLKLLLLHVFAENCRTCWKEPWNTCNNLSTNTVPTDPYVMIKVLILEGQLRHISRHLVQSSNTTKQWFDTRLLQLIQEKWQCWNWLFSTSTVYTMSNIDCPESCTENQLTFISGSQLDSYPIELKSLRRDHFTGRGTNQVAGGQHAGGWNWIFVKVGAMPTSFLEWENISNSFESSQFQQLIKIDMISCGSFLGQFILLISNKTLKERQAPRTPAAFYTYIAGLYAMRSGSGNL